MVKKCFLLLLLATITLNAQEWTSIKPDQTTESELVALFGNPNKVTATFSWEEWSAKWKKRPISTMYILKYDVHESNSSLLIGPGGQADNVEVHIYSGKVLSVNWYYGGPSAHKAAKSLRSDKSLHIESPESFSRAGKQLEHGWLTVHFGSNDSRIEVSYILK